MNKSKDLHKNQEEFLLNKALRFCEYQARFSNEVYKKLLEYGATDSTAKKLVTRLINSGLLNDEQYVKSYASGKHKNNRWGKIKISYELKKKGIPDSLISEAVNSIDENTYIETIKHLAEKKLQSIKIGNKSDKYQKTCRYLAGKGFEPGLINMTVNELLQEK